MVPDTPGDPAVPASPCKIIKTATQQGMEGAIREKVQYIPLLFIQNISPFLIG